MAEQFSGCLVCGKPLIYLEQPEEMVCSLCGARQESYAKCEDGHFICDACHMQKGLETIQSICLQSQSKNPIEIAQQIMEQPFIYLHGPEHHTLVGAVLLTACKNAGLDFSLAESLAEMEQRGKKIPGGVCGFNGCCGAAVSAGTFLSILMGATPLSGKDWGLCNLLTGKCLERIGILGGPRCCKRDSFTAILTAVDFLEEYLGIQLETNEKVVCSFSKENKECIHKKCPYFA